MVDEERGKIACKAGRSADPPNRIWESLRDAVILQADQQKLLPWFRPGSSFKKLPQLCPNSGIVLTGIAQVIKQQAGKNAAQRRQ